MRAHARRRSLRRRSVQHDAEIRFRARAAKGSRKTGLALLDKLDRSFARR